MSKPASLTTGCCTPVPQYHPADVLGGRLLVELGGVDTDHHQLVGELLLQPFKIGNHMDAVDTPVGPEVEHHDLSPQGFERKRVRGVQPIETDRELGGRRAEADGDASAAVRDGILCILAIGCRTLSGRRGRVGGGKVGGCRTGTLGRSCGIDGNDGPTVR